MEVLSEGTLITSSKHGHARVGIVFLIASNRIYDMLIFLGMFKLTIVKFTINKIQHSNIATTILRLATGYWYGTRTAIPIENPEN